MMCGDCSDTRGVKHGVLMMDVVCSSFACVARTSCAARRHVSSSPSILPCPVSTSLVSCLPRLHLRRLISLTCCIDSLLRDSHTHHCSHLHPHDSSSTIHTPHQRLCLQAAACSGLVCWDRRDREDATREQHHVHVAHTSFGGGERETGVGGRQCAGDTRKCERAEPRCEDTSTCELRARLRERVWLWAATAGGRQAVKSGSRCRGVARRSLDDEEGRVRAVMM